MKVIFILALLACAIPATASAQYGVCDRAASDAVNIVNSDANRRISNILRLNDPDYVKNSHITIINWNRDQSLQSVRMGWYECGAGYKGPQQIVDTAVTVYTLGINRMLPPGMAHVDISEVFAGTPLGGPSAVIPQMRERILGNDNSTPANIIRDPIRCLTFQRSC